MLDLNSFRTVNTKTYNALIYFGENHYYIFTYPNKDSYYLCVTKLDSQMEEELDTQDNYVCSSLSSAIQVIEALERGEEI